MSDNTFPALTDDQKIDLIKRTVNSAQGWRNLALSLQGKPESAKEECIRLLKLSAGEKEIDIPILKEGDTTDEKSAPPPPTVKVKLADLLIQQLEDNIARLNDVNS